MQLKKIKLTSVPKIQSSTEKLSQRDSNPQPLSRKRTLNHLSKCSFRDTQPLIQVFVYELSGCGFESRCSHSNFRYRASFEQEFLDIQATVECRFTLKRVRDMITTHSQGVSNLTFRLCCKSLLLFKVTDLEFL